MSHPDALSHIEIVFPHHPPKIPLFHPLSFPNKCAKNNLPMANLSLFAGRGIFLPGFLLPSGGLCRHCLVTRLRFELNFLGTNPTRLTESPHSQRANAIRGFYLADWYLPMLRVERFFR
jgi:hypothetical protein